MQAFVGNSGTHRDPTAGIAAVALDGTRSRMLGVTAGSARNAMYLAASPDGRLLYATSAMPDGRVSAWATNGSTLSQVGPDRPSGGGVPCHLSVHPAGRHLLTANYATGSVAVHPINEDGGLAEASQVLRHDGNGPDASRQDRAHPHMITIDPGAESGQGDVLVVDLGTDNVHRYHLDLDSGRLEAVDRLGLPPGTGPRHLVARDRYGYVVGELNSTVTVVDLRSSPPAVLATTSTVPVGAGVRSQPSAIRLSPDGRRLYVLNRGPDTIAVLSADGPEVALVATVRAGGEQPWDAVTDGSWLYVATKRSGRVTAFRIDQSSGIPEPTGTALRIPQPVCILPAVTARPER
jgi:6-phosphogluconolactonase (cycloisomerase 2 family)